MIWARTLAVRATKQAALVGLDAPSLKQAVEGRYESLRTLFKSDDIKEGPRAFAEKRPPSWKGA